MKRALIFLFCVLTCRLLEAQCTPSALAAPAAICAGQTATLTASGGASYTWTPGGMTASSIVVSPTSSTVYTLTATTGTCVASATVLVSVYASPNVTASNNGPVCVNSAINLYASGSGGGLTYSWSGPNSFSSGSPNPTLGSATSGMAGGYNVTVTDFNGCTSSATTTVIVNPLPVVTASNSSPGCQGSDINLIANNSGVQYAWTGPNSFVSNQQNPSLVNAVISMSGTYVLTVTDANGCSNSAITSVTVNPNPTVTVNSATICAGATATLTAYGASTYTWNVGQNAATILATPMSTTNYTVFGMDANGCMDSAVANVAVTPLPSLSVTANAAALCSGGTATLSASGATTFTWSANAGGSSANAVSVTPNATTTYTVAGTMNGCSDSTMITVSVTQTPTISTVASPITVCAGQSATLTASGAPSYTWSANAGSAQTNTVSVSPGSSTTYTVVGDNMGCVSSYTIAINVAPSPTVTASPGQLTCVANTATISASSTGSGVTYSWAGTGIVSGGNTSAAVVNSVGYYTVTVTDPASGCAATATTSVISNTNPPPIVITGGSLACPTYTTTVVASILPPIGAGPYTYTWSGPGIVAGSSASTATVNAAGIYMGTVTDASNGCSSSSSFPVQTVPLPTVTYTLQADTTPHVWDAYPTYSGGVQPYSVVWSWGDSSVSNLAYPSHTYSAAGTYSICVTLTDANGCSDTYCESDSVYRSANSSMVQVDVINTSSGIGSLVQNVEMKIYPNPANAELMINTIDRVGAISIYNSLGGLVQQQSFTGQSVRLNISSLREGIYFVSVEGASGVFTQKILIRR